MQVDPAELLDAAEVAAVIGLDNPRGVSVYRRRYPDFPKPVVARGHAPSGADQTLTRDRSAAPTTRSS